MPNTNANTFYPEAIGVQEMYKLMIGSVVPRPIAWVSTKSKEGMLNLAPFSFFTVASRQPPTLSITIGRGAKERAGTVKDTLTNIRETKTFIINVVPEALANQMYESSKHVESSVNEFEKACVTPVSSQKSGIPYVKESPIAFECALDRIIKVGTDHMVLGQIQCVCVDESSYSGNYRINIENWKPLARLAGNYAPLGCSFKLPK
ncbi:flavin reductase family protein [Virgibacillus alimentarius]|uniref:flavin reductase family protein n=1 Tax=Virgibacillus alimentarius TaxID=698769 RepID=UPI000493A26E|nr:MULTISPECIES: flavin reductase family protein [Virgibacillus]HLR66714.1 flavin reductase family protein [Virgibacillus sp.]